MQDRFKFRVWDKEYNKMYLPKRRSNFVDVNGTICEIESFVGGDGFMRKMIKKEFNSVVLMQCTGLKDKNGKLIYEGDIIVIPKLYPFYDYKEKEEHPSLNDTKGEIKGEATLNYVGIVEWIYSQWQYVYHCVNPSKNGINEGINNGLNDIGYEESECTDFEVIGNIYENPELLTEDKE